MTPRQALERIGKTLTQVFDMPIKKFRREEYKILEKLVKEKEEKDEKDIISNNASLND